MARGVGLQRVGGVIAEQFPEFVVSKRRIRQIEAIQMVRSNRESMRQTLGFSSRPFVLCGLPHKRSPADHLLHQRRNGQFVLQVAGHPSYGLPYGQDRLVPIFLATVAIRRKSR